MAVSDNFRPTLLVGVGGTGSKIAESIMAQAVANDDSLGNWIRVLALDTDENDINRLKQLNERSSYQFSRPEKVYRLLERNSSVEGDWAYRRSDDPPMSQAVLGMSLIEGAGQIRMLTRLALHDSFQNYDLLDRFEKAIADLTVHSDAQRFGGNIHILVVGSLAGATGSGSFIQTALGLKLAAANRDVLATVRGVFLLPDVYARSGALPTSQVPNVLANGYAAIKELNAVNVRAMLPNQRTNFEYEFVPGQTLKTGGVPFEAITFIDYENSNGGSMGRNLNSYINMAARAGYLMVFSPLGAAYGSVTINDVRQRLAAINAGRTNLYSGIGVSAISYPVDSMRRYLTRRLVIENLKGDWTRLDSAFRDQMARYKKDVAAGLTSAEEPLRGPAYVRDIAQLAKEDPAVPFFRRAHEYLFPEREDERTYEKKVTPLHMTFADALTDYVTGQFWGADDMSRVRSRTALDDSSILESDSVIDVIRREESELDKDFSSLEAALQQRPNDILQNAFISGDALGSEEWSTHHIQTYIGGKGAHPVAVRAFLYHLQAEIETRRSALAPRELKRKLFRIANGFRSEEEMQSQGAEPNSRTTPGIIDAASKASDNGVIGRVFKSKIKKFAGDYVDYYNASQRGMLGYATATIHAKVLDQLLSEVNGLIRAYEGMFAEIEVINETLSAQAEAEITPYEGTSTSFNGDAYVYANRSCKEDAWRRLSDAATGLAMDDQVNRKLTLAVYEKHRTDSRERRSTDFSDLRELFMADVVVGFGQRTVQKDFASVYDFSIIEALRREFKVEDDAAEAAGEAVPRTGDERLRRIVDRAAKQSLPYLSFSRPETDGTAIKFWTIHPECESALNDESLFSELFRSNDGDRPIVEAEFSQYELICVNLRVNLELQQMSKLAMADADGESVHARTEGRMTAAYRSLVENMIKGTKPGKEAAEFTPHVDRRWHLPGVLPELFSEIDEKIGADYYRSFVIAHLLGFIRRERDEGAPVTRLVTVGYGVRDGIDQIIAETHDLWKIYKAMLTDVTSSRSVLAVWSTMTEEATGNVSSHRVFGKLTDANVLVELFGIAATRNNDVEDRDEAVVAIAEALISVIRELVETQETSLSPRARSAIVRGTVDTLREDLVRVARAEQYSDSIIRVFETLMAKAFDNAFARG